MSPVFDPGLRRVSVHAGGAVTDLALPAGVAVAVLIPSIVDILSANGLDGSDEARRYQLACPGAAPLNSSATLAQNGIRDGAVLVLVRDAAPPVARRHDDVAEAVSATLDAAGRRWCRPRRRCAARLTGAIAAGCLTGIGAAALVRQALSARVADTTVGVVALAAVAALLAAAAAHRGHGDAIGGLVLSVMATAFAALAGFLAVPGPPGPPHVMLAGAAAAVTSVLAMRVSGCGAVTLTALTCVATVVAAAALLGVVTDAPVRAIGSASTLASVVLLGAAARIAIALAGLSPQLPPAPDVDRRAIRADAWLTSLRAGFSSAGAVGAVVTVLAGAPGPGCTAFGALTGALLLLRARSDDGPAMLVCAAGGMAVTATAFGAIAANLSRHGAWVAAMTAALAVAAVYLGSAAPAASLSLLSGPGLGALRCAVLVAMIPMTCWVCGLYGAVRGWTVT